MTNIYFINSTFPWQTTLLTTHLALSDRALHERLYGEGVRPSDVPEGDVNASPEVLRRSDQLRHIVIPIYRTENDSYSD